MVATYLNDEDNTHWLTIANEWLAAGGGFVIVTVLATQGSTPQKPSAKMLVGAQQTLGTVGGGRLEERCVETARQVLGEQKEQQVCVWTLGASMGQCCGGKVAVLFEYCDGNQPNVALFGLGHIGLEVAAAVARLPYRLVAVNTYPDKTMPATVAAAQVIDGDAETIFELPTNAHVLVMTHSHELDFALCKNALQHLAESRFIGLIGSHSKATRFRQRLARLGLAADRLICPIGRGGVHPAEIAVSIVAALVLHLSPPAARSTAKNKTDAEVMRALAPLESSLSARASSLAVS